MYKNIFDNHLAQNKKFDAYMFWGQSDYLIEEYSNTIALSFAPKEDIQKIYFDEYNFENCINILSQSSLFCSINVLLIKIIKKIPKKDIDSLIKVCNLNQDSHVIFACIGDVDFKTMTKSFVSKSNSVEVRFFPPTPKEAIKILEDKSINKNIKFSQDALMHLYEMHERNISLCICDIDKLSVIDDEVTTRVISNQCFGMGLVSLDDFFIRLFSGQPYKAQLYKILEEGINEIYLINQITSFAQQLFFINTYLKLYGTLDIIKIWGYPLPKNIANQRASIAVKFNQQQFVFMLDWLLRLELELKSSKIIDLNIYVQANLRLFAQQYFR